jgi:carboxymethylenebutenolidase
VFWRLERNWEADHDQAGLEASLALVQKVDFPQAVADCVAALHHIEELPEVSGRGGVIGFCFGGTIAYLVAATTEPACCVSYYGSGVPGMLDQLDNIDCPVLFHFGDVDGYIPGDQVAAVAEAVAGREHVTLNVEHGGHAFDNHESAVFYDEGAAKAAWPKTTAFLEQHLPA